MQASTSSALTVVGGSLLAYCIYAISTMGRREPGLPPGPPTLPVLGNTLEFPKKFAHMKFTEWAKIYGDIFSLKLGSGTVVVLSSAATIKEILDKRSATTSSRPPLYMGEYVTGNRNMIGAPYGDVWRSLRRAAHEILGPQICRVHLPVQNAEAVQLMYDLLTRPEDYTKSCKRYSSSVITCVAFGQRSPRYETPATTEIFEILDMWQDIMTPGNYPPVDLVPMFRYVPEPFAKWKTVCKDVRQLQRHLYFGQLEELERRRASEGDSGCWMEMVIDRADEWGLDRESIGYLGGVLMEGGSETISSFIRTMMLALIAHPEVQKKAQEEIDLIVGTERLPEREDFEKLPYCKAIIDEVQRWRTINPLSVFHTSIADETYRGYFIPSGTVIFMNTWAIFHDPDIFEDPESFNPDRFLTDEFGMKPGAAERVGKDWRSSLPFGAGRRLCPGIHFAINALQINVMNILWGFNLRKAIDAETGKEIEPDLWNFTSLIANSPLEFPCRIEPRSPQHAALIREQLKDAIKLFEQYELHLNPEDKAYVAKERQALT